jgi:hypothetical protein
MPARFEFDGSLDRLPAMLTVDEAANVLRIGRSLAYQLATRYLESGTDGLPVIRLGGVLRVPGPALRHLIVTGEIIQLSLRHTDSATTVSRSGSARATQRRRAQLSLAIDS